MAKSRTPEKAEAHKAYMREYNQRPEVMAHRLIYDRSHRRRARRQAAAAAAAVSAAASALDGPRTVADALYAVASAIDRAVAALATDKEGT